MKTKIEFNEFLEETLTELYEISNNLMLPEKMHQGFFKMGLLISRLEAIADKHMEDNLNGHC